ncbi:hypothetical protein C8A03DRAFT_39007 [Achaetomium macrosporum]|uniref:Uncharacterized protein n=1 Tax=Achaetomium macrosporum TaxID=79813 RepID=A0AAN7C0X0_9PEZI|nr:hypothetical protein C8A03DRAFT_39007 [Achaetomium macrosporum]
MQLTLTLITAVLATHTASAFPTGGSNGDGKAAFNQPLQREMLNDVQSSSGASREESWTSEQQVDPKLADSASQTEMIIRVIKTPTPHPDPWDAVQKPAPQPSPWDQNNKLPSIQQKSHIPTHPKDGGRQFVNSVGGRSELEAKQGMSNGAENADMVGRHLPASDISSAASRMGNARQTEGSTATPSSEKYKPGFTGKVRELFRSLVHGEQQQHAAQEQEVQDRVRMAPRNHEKDHKEDQQQASSELSVGIRQMSPSSKNKIMTSLPQDASNQNQKNQEMPFSLNPRTEQVREGQQMQKSQPELMGCLRAAMGDINK